MWFFIFAGVLTAIMCVAIFFLHRKEVANRQGLKTEAERLGLQYSYVDPFGIAATYSHLNQLSQGSNRFAFNCIAGRYDGCMTLAFDYQYSVDNPKRRRNQPPESFILSVLILMMQARFPHLIIRPPMMAERFPELPDEMEEIRLENAAFSTQYLTRSTSRRFAEAVLHPGMVDYLVKHPSTSIEINGNTLLVHLAEIMTPEALESQLKRLVEIYRLIPREVFDMVAPEEGEQSENDAPSDSE